MIEQAERDFVRLIGNHDGRDMLIAGEVRSVPGRRQRAEVVTYATEGESCRVGTTVVFTPEAAAELSALWRRVSEILADGKANTLVTAPAVAPVTIHKDSKGRVVSDV